MDVFHQIIGHLQLLGGIKQLILAHGADAADLLLHQAHMAHSLHDVAGSGLALGADHGSAFVDTAQSLAQITGATDERHVKSGLVNVVFIISGREHFALVNVVDLDGLQDLGLNKVADAALRHDRDRNGLLNALDHLRVAHAGHAAGSTDIRGDALQSHNGAGACVFCDLGLLGGGNIHNNAALEHLGQVFVQFKSVVVHCDSLLTDSMVPPPTTISPSYSTTACPFVMARWGASKCRNSFSSRCTAVAH